MIYNLKEDLDNYILQVEAYEIADKNLDSARKNIEDKIRHYFRQQGIFHDITFDFMQDKIWFYVNVSLIDDVKKVMDDLECWIESTGEDYQTRFIIYY